MDKPAGQSMAGIARLTIPGFEQNCVDENHHWAHATGGLFTPLGTVVF